MALPPSKRGEMGACYSVCGTLELSADWGYIYGPAYPVKGPAN
jgi:hypothetical protein